MSRRSDQTRHYAALVRDRRATQGFSCGYYERFDPFLLEAKPFLAAAYERLFALCFPRPVGTLIDVGCGTGLYWPILRRYCTRLIGVDASAEMIAEADRLVRERGMTGIETMVRPMEDLQLPGLGADAALCIDVLHHVESVSDALAQVAGLLRPGGRLCVVEPNALNPLIFLAHLLPREERGAVRRNYAPLYRARFNELFTDVRTHYLNVVSSARSAREVELVDRVGRVISAVPGLRAFSLRQLFTMEKR